MMSTLLELPHTAGCFVCGRQNTLGLRFSLYVDPASGVVSIDFTPQAEHIGFDGIIHGGMLATVLDEAMVWAATWSNKRFCVCGELTVRFRRPARVGEMLHLAARVEFSRPKLIQTTATIRTPDGGIVATAEGKYVPMPKDASDLVVQTFVDEESTLKAAKALHGADEPPLSSQK